MEKHVACIATGEHRGKSRFPTRHSSPNLKAWRCDLTAFSQRHNLYFLASTSALHVYQPGFPDQSLASEPDLILHPPVTGHGGPGIDWEDPHSINRILVEYLGNEEVLLVACDDGDVIGYRTEMIHRALERRSRRLEPASKDDVHVFLHRNVGASAWGLAIHREARIIAISANTHQIAIIAYALTDQNEGLDNSHSREKSRLSRQFPFWRQEETTFTLSAANNLPSLSFYGNSGRWLLSSCIDGKTVLWDLHTRQEAATYQLGWCKSTKDLSDAPGYNSLQWGFMCICPAASNVLHGAWGTIALDTRPAYHLPLAEEQTLGPEEVANRFWDVTTQKKRFTVEKRNSPVSYAESSGSEDGSGVGEDDYDDEDEDPTHIQPQQIDYQVEELAQLEILQSILQGHQNLPDIPNLIASMIPQHLTPLPPISVPSPYCAISKRKQSMDGDDFAEDDLQDPFIILTKEDIFLVQRPFTANNTQERSDYIVSMRRPLHPGDQTAPLSSPDRHCFFAQIPELGIFIVGSPIGHAGVFSLYWTQDEGGSRRRYGFKLEYLLPFKQENENAIAVVPQGRDVGLMLGVAVAPVQGMFDGSCDREQHGLQPRRWRVLMYYMDHTVLSFELSKPRVSDTLVLSELVV